MRGGLAPSLFRAKWSQLTHDEWTRWVVKNRADLPPNNLRRTRETMDMHVRDRLVDKCEDLIPVLQPPYPKDRHVLAPAIRGRADVIVTYNLTKFSDGELQKYGIASQHLDEFLTHLLALAPTTVCADGPHASPAIEQSR